MRWALLALTFLSSTSCGVAAERVACADNAAYLHVDTSSHRLSACRGSAAERTYGVRLGKGGVGKTRDGDGKVPLGVYRLGMPRPSKLFGTFVPVEYPTKEQ